MCSSDLPNVAYTVAATGSLPGPTGELLFNATPFVYRTNIYPPNPGFVRGSLYRLSERPSTIQFQTSFIEAPFYSTVVDDIQPKTAVAYQETRGERFTRFTLLSAQGQTLLNSANAILQINNTLSSGSYVDFFLIGNTNTQNPEQFTAYTNRVLYDSASGCSLIQGTNPFPDITNLIVSFTPVLCLALTIVFGLAFLFALVALLF